MILTVPKNKEHKYSPEFLEHQTDIVPEYILGHTGPYQHEVDEYYKDMADLVRSSLSNIPRLKINRSDYLEISPESFM